MKILSENLAQGSHSKEQIVAVHHLQSPFSSTRADLFGEILPVIRSHGPAQAIYIYIYIYKLYQKSFVFQINVKDFHTICKVQTLFYGYTITSGLRACSSNLFEMAFRKAISMKLSPALQCSI